MTEAGRDFHNQDEKSKALVSKFLVTGIKQSITNKILVTFEPGYGYFIHVLHYCQPWQMQMTNVGVIYKQFYIGFQEFPHYLFILNVLMTTIKSEE